LRGTGVIATFWQLENTSVTVACLPLTLLSKLQTGVLSKLPKLLNELERLNVQLHKQEPIKPREMPIGNVSERKMLPTKHGSDKTGKRNEKKTRSNCASRVAHGTSTQDAVVGGRATDSIMVVLDPICESLEWYGVLAWPLRRARSLTLAHQITCHEALGDMSWTSSTR
jgi:hypothetical protein